MKPMADVIDLAINKYLWDGRNEYNRAEVRDYSCHAIFVTGSNKTTEITDFLRSMGLDPENTEEFHFAPSGQRRQYARALWLTWAAMIAREEGKTL